MIKNYQSLSKEELVELLEEQDTELRSKKYGLVWDKEKEPEKVVLDCKSHLPILKRVKKKEIKTDDSNDNILIEGDNYHALTVLNYTHKNKIDVIYIDPPYNTGNKDFVYNDRYVDKEDGYRHSKWLNFMEKRLNLAKELLKETGVIFISIDDNEMAQLKLLCDRVFGEENFIGQFIKQSKVGGGSDSKFIVKEHEHCFCYSKSIELTKPFFIDHDEKYLKRYKERDDKGRFFWDTFARPGLKNPINYDIVAPDGKIINGDWIRSKKRFDADYKNGEIRILNKKDGSWSIQFKQRLNHLGKKPRSMTTDFGGTIEGKNDLKNIFGNDIFSYPKSVKYIKTLINLISDKNSLILDFMAGSGTTGHAILELNKEDGGNRKFILCTNNEVGEKQETEFKKKYHLDDKKFKQWKGESRKKWYDWCEKYGICSLVTHPRLEKVIKGYKENGNGGKIKGLKGNLQYFKTDLIKQTSNRDQVKMNLTKKCTEMLCVKESIFNLEKEERDYKVFCSNRRDKYLFVYYNFLEDSFGDFLKDLKENQKKKVVYMFSENNEVDRSLFSEISNFSIEPIPQKILDVYKQLVSLNIKS